MKGLQPFQVVWDVEVAQSHKVIAVRKAGFFKDKFELIVDNHLVLSETVGAFNLKGNRVIYIDDEPIDISWKWGIRSGSPESIILTRSGQVLATYPSVSSIVLDTADANTDAVTQLPVSVQNQLSLEQFQLLAAKSKAEKQLRGGASWFYWIAGLSIVNSLIWWLGGGTSFLIGLAVTQFIDGFISALATEIGAARSVIITLIALALGIDATAILVILCFFANKNHKWSFIIGMMLSALDGSVF